MNNEIKQLIDHIKKLNTTNTPIAYMLTNILNKHLRRPAVELNKCNNINDLNNLAQEVATYTNLNLTERQIIHLFNIHTSNYNYIKQTFNELKADPYYIASFDNIVKCSKAPMNTEYKKALSNMIKSITYIVKYETCATIIRELFKLQLIPNTNIHTIVNEMLTKDLFTEDQKITVEYAILNYTNNDDLIDHIIVAILSNPYITPTELDYLMF